MISHTPHRVRPASRLRLTVSAIALASGLAGAAGVVGVATPAAAQCVENPANTHTCGGQTDTPIVIVGGVSPGVYTTAGFGVDTSANGNGAALTVNGTGLVSYTDAEGSVLAGGGVYFETTGPNVNSDGDIFVFSNGAITANGAAGLRLTNNGSADTVALWSGSIANLGGYGVDATTAAGSGDLTLILNQVTARDDAVRAMFSGDGFVDLTLGGPVISQTGAGVVIEAVGGGADGIRLRTTDVFGGTYGLYVVNQGTGFTEVVSTGAVTGLTEGGVRVSTNGLTTGIGISVNEVTSEEIGIFARNSGGGDTTITATGTVTSTGNFGIQGFNGTINSGDLTITAVDVSGHSSIVATNHGTGATRITSTGLLSAYGQEGVWAQNDVNATDVTVHVNAIDAAENGILIENLGSGLTEVRATGAVTGWNQSGIRIVTGPNSGDVTVDAVDVHGRTTGVRIENDGLGSTTVATTGTVEAFESGAAGIRIATGANTTDVTVTSATVQGRERGIDVSNGGTGETFVRSTALVTGDDFGIVAHNGLNATDLSIRAVDVESDSNGIWARNLGTGDTNVLVTGAITAANIGIIAQAGLTASDIYVDADTITGGAVGIHIDNQGNGISTVFTRGLVEGAVNAITINALGTQEAYLYNDGLISNSSGLSSDLAIIASGGLVEFTNSGQLIGTVDFSSDESLFQNVGLWDGTGGVSQFGGSGHVLVNSDIGVIVARSNAATQDTTTWLDLDQFENSGSLTLRDDGVGDVLQTTANSIFSEGSTLGVDIGGAGESDLFFTSGSLDLQEGSRLSVNIAGPLVLNSQYVVAAAFDGLTGRFDFDDVFLTAFAGLRDGYTDQTAYLEFVQLKALAEAGITPNQKEAAAGADSLPDGNPVKDALLLLPDEEAAIDAFDQLSGEVHPTARTALVEDSRLIRDAALMRLSDGEAGGAVWGRLIGDYGVSFGDENAARSDRESTGVLGGVDHGFGGGLTAGIALGWVETEVEIERRASVATVESLHGLAYVGGRFGAWGVRAGVGYAESSTETTRGVSFPGFGAMLEADYDGSVTQGFVEVGYRMPAGGGHVEPFLNLTALRVETDAFAEVAGPAALSGEEVKEDVMTSTLGLRFETNRMGTFSVRGVAGWRHAWGDLDPVGRHAFDGGATFTILGVAQSDDAAVANVEAQWRLARNVTFGVAYDGVLGVDSRDHAITAGVKVVF